MKNMLKQERGVSLISLAAAIIVIGIVVTMLLYSVKDTRDVTNLTNMYADIDNLTDKISNYYSVYGKIPAKDIDGLNELIASSWNNDGDPRGANDTGKYMYIDLNAIDNLTLNYGRSFSKIESKINKEETVNLQDDTEDFTDLYIINENSHNIFYLKGINIEGTMYYTNKDKDYAKVNLRYVDGVKILDDYTYKSGRKKESENPIIITDGTTDYTWINIEDGIYKLNSDGTTITDNEGTVASINIAVSQDKDKFLTSIDEYGGFYKDESGNVLYNDVVDKWSLTYDAEAVYKDNNGDTAYIPAGFQISELRTMNTINKGLVIRNATTLDEYVWIDVPDYVLKDANSLDEIERSLKAYSSSYSEDGYEDSWYAGCGIANQEAYNELKNKMYLSIKENGGFYIGRYEAGKGDSNEAVSQKEKNTYNNVTVSEAQGLATSVNSGDCTSSLMFGIQWDLACKFIEETGAKTYNEIAINSTEFGNYVNSSFDYKNDNTVYNKASGNSNLCRTGAAEKNIVLNTFDLAGNEEEYTLEHSNKGKAVVRGGCYQYWGQEYPISTHNLAIITNRYTSCGFRVTLFK